MGKMGGDRRPRGNPTDELVPKVAEQTTRLTEVVLPRRKKSQHPGRYLPRETNKPKLPVRYHGDLKNFWAWPIYFLNGKTVLIPDRSLKIMDDFLETKDMELVKEKHKLSEGDVDELFNDETFSAVFKDKMVRVNIKHGLSEEWFLEQLYDIYANTDGDWSQRERLEALREIGARKSPKQANQVNIEKPIINITMGALEASRERQKVLEAKVIGNNGSGEKEAS